MLRFRVTEKKQNVWIFWLVPKVGVPSKGLKGVEKLLNPTIRGVDVVRRDVVPDFVEILIGVRA